MRNSLHTFLTFRKMLTPLIIQFIFWLGVVLCVLSAFSTFFQGMFWRGLETLIIGPLLVRIGCELLILFFRINETLLDIKHGLKKE